MSWGEGRGPGVPMTSQVWLTPKHVIEDLGPFDLDPCGAPGWVTASDHILLPRDGLTSEWWGRVWLNPPYSQGQWPWLSRLADHGQGTALIFARTETVGFVREVWKRASAMLFLHGRLTFHYPDGFRCRVNAGAPSVLVAYGALDAGRLRESSLPGSFVSLDGQNNDPKQALKAAPSQNGQKPPAEKKEPVPA